MISPNSVAENVWLRLLARGAMILAAAFLPLVGYIGKTTLDGIDKTAEATLTAVNALSANERANRESILKLQGDIRLGEFKDTEQDRTLDRHEVLLTTRTRFPPSLRTEP